MRDVCLPSSSAPGSEELGCWTWCLASFGVLRTEGKLPSAQETSEEAEKRDAPWATSSLLSAPTRHMIGLSRGQEDLEGGGREREKKGEFINPSIAKVPCSYA